MAANQRLRYDLQVRKERLFAVDYQAIIDEFKLFFDFVRQRPLLSGIVEELRVNLPDFETKYGAMVKVRRILFPEIEKERVQVCLSFIDHCIALGRLEEPYQIAFQVGFAGASVDNGTRFFLEQFFVPFYDYLDQHIEEYSNVLYVLEKFKLRSEWFERARLKGLYDSDTAHGEAILDRELRRFLFDNGIEYPFSTPASPSGRADIIANLHTADPVVIEVKLFDAESRGRAYIAQGFRQITEYASDYHKDIGYLVIYNIVDKELKFTLKCTDKPPRIHLGDKTIFIIAIDIFHDVLPASERPKLEVYEIKENELLTA